MQSGLVAFTVSLAAPWTVSLLSPGESHPVPNTHVIISPGLPGCLIPVSAPGAASVSLAGASLSVDECGAGCPLVARPAAASLSWQP